MMILKPGKWNPALTNRVFNEVDRDRSGEVDSSEIIAWLFGVPLERRQAAVHNRRVNDRRACALAAQQAHQAATKGGSRRPSSGEVKVARGAPAGKEREAAAVVVDVRCGEQALQTVELMKHEWDRKFNGAVRVCAEVIKHCGSTNVESVSAREGALEFWNRSAMLPYRDDPFKNATTRRAWIEEMSGRHLPQLIQSTEVMARTRRGSGA
eukprot:TRINITY_DN22782_c0_g1_i1.p1 TRINITY_DN22782_c0_g1~~TRINITY_DN22782_c0_g1_i1.p1  ORF type:complete len:210 (-),score=39.25 TRINITY_DN22782_c0_g1_i1:99-728(-)